MARRLNLLIFFHDSLVSAFIAAGDRFQGQGKALLHTVLAGYGGESRFWQAPELLNKTVPTLEQSQYR